MATDDLPVLDLAPGIATHAEVPVASIDRDRFWPVVVF
jgi:hypothetical protein